MGNSVSVIEYKDLLNQLSEKDMSHRDRENMEKFCMYSEDGSDQGMVYTAITAEDIKALKQNRPMNLLYMIREIVDIFYSLATSYELFDDSNIINTMKGCINMLIRLLPFIIDNKAYTDKVLWDGDDNWGVKLCEGILIMLFKPGFTVKQLPSDVVSINSKGIDQNVLWKNGVSTSGDVHNHYTDTYDKNKISLLRLLLICISSPLYHGSEEYLTILNPFCCFFTCRRAKNVKNLFVSLLNNIISYDIEGYRIPYFSSVNVNGDNEKLLELGLHILLILIEYKPPTEENMIYLINGGYTSLKKIFTYFESQENPEHKEEKSLNDDLTTNEFHRLLQVIHGKMNLEPFVESLTKYFYNLTGSTQTYLPNSVTQIPFYQELFILFWRFIQGNLYFVEEVVSHPEFLPKIYAPILYYFDVMKKDPTKCNFLYICVFILLSFSSNRDFSMVLNDPYTLQLQFDLKDFEGGSYADLTYQVIQRMIKVGPGILRPLYKSLVSVISNTAPYVKSLSKDSSESIFSLIKTFSNPELLKKREETSRILGNLFEAVNYVLLYHDEGNEEFLVSLIKYRDIMKINDLKLSESEKSIPIDSEQSAAEDSKQTISTTKTTNNALSDPKSQEKTNEIIKPEEENKDKSTVQNATEINNDKHDTTQEIKEDTENKEANEEAKQEIKEESKEAIKPLTSEPTKETTEDAKIEENSKSSIEEEKVHEEVKDENSESMVDVPLDDIKHQQTSESVPVSSDVYKFLSPEWEKEWKNSLNLPNLKQAIQYTDDKARAFLAKNPSPDNNIDADKFVEFLKKSSLKGLLPNQVKILVTTYNGNNSIDTWAISYIWGQVFMRQQEIPLFNVDSIKMFKVNYVNQS